MRRALPALLLTLWIGASACAAAQWKPCGSERISGPQGSSFSAPAGWMFVQAGNDTVLSVDGPNLQAIHVVYRPKAPSTGKEFDASTPPSELADIFIAELEKNSAGLAEILENELATVAGTPGFRLRVRHNKHVQRMPIDAYEIYGVGHGEGLFVLSFGAFETYLFDRDLEAFRDLVKSFQLPAAPATSSPSAAP